MGQSRHLLHPFQLSSSLDAGSCSLFVTKQLNLFPVKGELSSKLSPKQIMSGEVVQYKFCAMDFGRYCQIHEEDQPHNGMVARTQGAILLGPSGNTQGGHKFFTLTTGKVVICWAWTELPTFAAVIERVHLLAKGMAALPIFTDRASHVIGDVKDVYLPNIEDEDVEALVDNSNLPGVHTAEADDEIPGVDMVQEQDVDVDLDFIPADKSNVEPPLVDIPPPVNDAPVVSKAPTDGGTRRSTQICTQLKPQYIPAFSGKTYSFATMLLGMKMLVDVAYHYNQSVAFSFMQQLLVKSSFREWEDDARAAGEKEVNQLHWRETFVPRRMSELTAEQRTKILQSHMFIGQKRTGETKARMVAGGNTQHGHVTKEESNSPTVSTEAVLLVSIVDAHEGRDVAVIDILNAFIQT
jgi:hypothetical protein